MSNNGARPKSQQRRDQGQGQQNADLVNRSCDNENNEESQLRDLAILLRDNERIKTRLSALQVQICGNDKSDNNKNAAAAAHNVSLSDHNEETTAPHEKDTNIARNGAYAISPVLAVNGCLPPPVSESLNSNAVPNNKRRPNAGEKNVRTEKRNKELCQQKENVHTRKEEHKNGVSRNNLSLQNIAMIQPQRQTQRQTTASQQQLITSPQQLSKLEFELLCSEMRKLQDEIEQHRSRFTENSQMLEFESDSEMAASRNNLLLSPRRQTDHVEINNSEIRSYSRSRSSSITTHRMSSNTSYLMGPDLLTVETGETPAPAVDSELDTEIAQHNLALLTAQYEKSQDDELFYVPPAMSLFNNWNQMNTSVSTIPAIPRNNNISSSVSTIPMLPPVQSQDIGLAPASVIYPNSLMASGRRRHSSQVEDDNSSSSRLLTSNNSIIEEQRCLQKQIQEQRDELARLIEKARCSPNMNEWNQQQQQKSGLPPQSSNRKNLNRRTLSSVNIPPAGDLCASPGARCNSIAGGHHVLSPTSSRATQALYQSQRIQLEQYNKIKLELQRLSAQMEILNPDNILNNDTQQHNNIIPPSQQHNNIIPPSQQHNNMIPPTQQHNNILPPPQVINPLHLVTNDPVRQQASGSIPQRGDVANFVVYDGGLSGANGVNNIGGGIPPAVGLAPGNNELPGYCLTDAGPSSDVQIHQLAISVNQIYQVFWDLRREMSQVSDRLASLETQIVSQDCGNLDNQINSGPTISIPDLINSGTNRIFQNNVWTNPRTGMMGVPGGNAGAHLNLDDYNAGYNFVAGNTVPSRAFSEQFVSVPGEQLWSSLYLSPARLAGPAANQAPTPPIRSDPDSGVSSGALNNQVSPGMRANNYYDNFRSFSRQNRLDSLHNSPPNVHQNNQSINAQHGINLRQLSPDAAPANNAASSYIKTRKKHKINREQNMDSQAKNSTNLTRDAENAVQVMSRQNGRTSETMSGATPESCQNIAETNHSSVDNISKNIYSQIESLISSHEGSPEFLASLLEDLTVLGTSQNSSVMGSSQNSSAIRRNGRPSNDMNSRNCCPAPHHSRSKDSARKYTVNKASCVTSSDEQNDEVESAVRRFPLRFARRTASSKWTDKSPVSSPPADTTPTHRASIGSNRVALEGQQSSTIPSIDHSSSNSSSSVSHSKQINEITRRPNNGNNRQKSLAKDQKVDMNQEQANPDVIASNFNINIAANSATVRPTNFVYNNSGASQSGMNNKELLSGYSVPKNQQRRNMTRGEPRKPSARHQELPKNMQNMKPLHPDNQGFLTVQLEQPIRQELNREASKEDDHNVGSMLQHNTKHNNTVDTSGDQQAVLNTQDNYAWQHQPSSSSQQFHHLFSHQSAVRHQPFNNPDIGQMIQNFPNQPQDNVNEGHPTKKEALRQYQGKGDPRDQANQQEQGNLRQEIKKAFRQLEPVRQNLQQEDQGRDKTKSLFSNQTNRNMKNYCAVPKFDSSFTGDEVCEDGVNGLLSEESAGGVAELAEADQIQPAVHDENNLYWTTQASHQNLSFHWPVNQQHDPILREAVNQRNCADGIGEDGNNSVGVLREVTGSEDFTATNQTPVLQMHPRYQVVGHDDDERGEMDDSSDVDDDEVTVSMMNSRLHVSSGSNYAKERREEEQVNSLVEEVLASSPDLALANTGTADDLPPYSG